MVGASAIAGGLLSGVTGVGEFGVDTVMKVANFVGFKNLIGIGVTAAGAIGGNEALTFAGIGSFIGGKSTIGTLVGTGAGFVVGSMLQADDVLPGIDIKDIALDADTPEVSAETSAKPIVGESKVSTDRYSSKTDINDIMTENSIQSDNSEYSPEI